MESQKKGLRGRHIFAGVLALSVGLTQIWIIQLARGGDPVGYMLLAGEGVLASVLVVGLIIAVTLSQVAKVNRVPASPRRDLKELYETTRLLTQHNKSLRQLLEEQGEGGGASSPPSLRPGQMMTADGLVIEGEAFDQLDEEE